MTRFPEDNFSETQIDRLHDAIQDRQRENPNFSRRPRSAAEPPLRVYRKRK